MDARMKFINNSTVVSIALASLLFFSCNVLDVEQESSFAPSNFYKNTDDAHAAIVAVYEVMNSNNMYNQAMWIIQDQSTDDAEWGEGRATANQAKNDLDKFTFTPATSTFYSVWTACYLGITRANTALERIPGIEMNAELKDRLIGEAKFMRAFYYFTLVRLFGEVPLVLTETKLLNAVLQIPRSPINEVYVQIIADFTDAETALLISYTGAEVGRATKGAAKAFLAKVYLTRQEWAKASAKAKEVMDLGVYDLWENFDEAFLVSNENGKESVFEVQAVGGGFSEGSYMQGYMRPPFDHVNGVAGFGDNPVTRNLYDAYSATDKRRDCTLKLYADTTTPAAPSSIIFPCYVKKYTDPAATSNNEGNNNFPIIRYADVLLMYAEALNEQHANNADAYSALNRIRMRAGLPALTPVLTQEQFRDSVLLERRLELAFEGHRRYDLVRTGKLIAAINAQNPTIAIQQHHVLLPIPQTERDVNVKLTQNTGY
jgi:hypothetical protein